MASARIIEMLTTNNLYEPLAPMNTIEVTKEETGM